VTIIKKHAKEHLFEMSIVLTQRAKVEFKKVNTLLEKMNQSLGFSSTLESGWPGQGP
jgi:hypothetical protein